MEAKKCNMPLANKWWGKKKKNSKLFQWNILECQTYFLNLDDGTTILTKEFGE
jgi:hypothetical protein